MEERTFIPYNFEEENKIYQQKLIKVSNRDYCKWLNDFISRCKDNRYDDESFGYETLKVENLSQKDKVNEKVLDAFYRFLKIVAKTQRVAEYYDTRCFEEIEYVFKFNDKYFEYNTLIGQGSVTTIKLIEKPLFAVVDLDLYFRLEDEGIPMREYKD